tara:strand:+ start:444 stop:1088 length:645 start_codon:yes stop_codon:yes gene_type:complete
MPTPRKDCCVCKKNKLLEDFHKNKRKKDGHSETCKVCANERSKKWRIENKEKSLSNLKKWKENNKDLKKEMDKKYYQKNRDKIIQRSRKYYQENKNLISERERLYYQRNKDKILNRVANYYKTEAGKEVSRNQRHRRRARYKNSNITKDWLMQLKENTVFCSICEVKMNNINHHPDQYNLDHIIPLKFGGSHSKNNVRFICRQCNLNRPKGRVA